MKKPKIITKDNKTFLRIETEKGESLGAREVEVISRGADGLFSITIVPKGKVFRLFYDITGYITLESYLKSGLRKQAFAELLEDIYNTLQSLNATFLKSNAILLSINRVFVSPGTKRVCFIFIPIQLYNTNVTLRSFYLDIVKSAVFSQGENLEYLDELTKILNRGINVSLFDLSEYIDKISGKSYIRSLKSRCKKCNAINNKDSFFCVSCGVSFKDVEKESTVYDPLKAAAVVSMPRLKNPDFDSPVRVVSQSIDKMPVSLIKAYLIQKRTGQTYLIEKLSYKIGKSGCDCNIPDNPVISRLHAEIIQREGHFFLIDLFSTNKTFVNETSIPAKTEIELLSNFIIRFGNEEFKFCK